MKKVASTVATKILEQLGGNRFVAMTGARKFVYDESSLTMRLGTNAKRVSVVTIKLTSADEYEVTAFTGGGYHPTDKIREVSRATVQVAELVAWFEETTGLATKL